MGISFYPDELRSNTAGYDHSRELISILSEDGWPVEFICTPLKGERLVDALEGFYNELLKTSKSKEYLDKNGLVKGDIVKEAIDFCKKALQRGEDVWTYGRWDKGDSF